MNSWDQVELFRHQYGELPKDNDTRTVDYRKAFAAAANNVERGQCSQANAASMLRAASSICASTQYGTKYNHGEYSCFVCGQQTTRDRVDVALEYGGDAFNSKWCGDCCEAFFKQRRAVN